MSLLEHAENELELIGEIDYGDDLKKDVLELIKLFSGQGHSGGSAILCLDIFNRLAHYKILTPLTGKDDEWCEVEVGIFQNKRCLHVFKEDDVAYDINGLIFVEKNGATYTNINSRTKVTFPYTPSSKYVNV